MTRTTLKDEHGSHQPCVLHVQVCCLTWFVRRWTCNPRGKVSSVGGRLGLNMARGTSYSDLLFLANVC
ncbi:hypothetical protein QQP08_024543 [Theobroma cacao]|nr:hypothetical protein QQP08_024543 [Theobroma cacao]